MSGRETILREDVDAGRVEWAELDSGERLPPVHPGEVLRHEFLDPLGLTAHALALALRVPANRITAILKAERGITAETALRLARHFGTTPGFWLNLQNAYELEIAEQQAGPRIRAEVEPRERKTSV